jgi:hypothetical protein
MTFTQSRISKIVSFDLFKIANKLSNVQKNLTITHQRGFLGLDWTFELADWNGLKE